VHDYSGGIQLNGLFWTVQIPRDKFSLRSDRTRASLDVRNLPMTDSFVIFGPNVVPATVDIHIEWRATGPAVPLGEGDAVDPTDPASFLGEIAPARAEASFGGRGLGFAFRSLRGANTARGYAEIGTERNGAFL
jgi:hypothetical protein